MSDEHTFKELSHAVSHVARELQELREQRQNEFDWIKSLSGLVTKHDLKEMENRIMAKIEEVLQDISDESTLEDSILALVTGIKQQLADALANVTVPADVQAKIDAAFAQLEANKAKLTDAITANTPAAP